jgi:hypothetical protein
MSRYTLYYNTKRAQYLELAKQWFAWAETANLSDVEIAGMQKFFKSLATRFGLVSEFRDLGVIE